METVGGAAGEVRPAEDVASYASAKEIFDPTAAHYEEAQREPLAIISHGRVSGEGTSAHPMIRTSASKFRFG